MGYKIDRISKTIQIEISNIIAREVRDSNVGYISITDCKVTNDLSYAKIYFTVLKEEQKEASLNALQKASGFIRRELATKIEVKHVPQLIFIYDESEEYGSKIEKLIEEQKK